MKMSRISARLRWMAGTRMCEGRSWPSWTISSARSVSQTSMPSWRRASLSSISWVAIDLTLTTSSRRAPWTIAATIAFASAASRAQWTVPPAAVTARLELLEERGQVAQDLVLDRGPGQPQLLPVGDLGDGRGPLVADRGRGAGQVRPELLVAPAPRARPRGNGGMPAKVGSAGSRPAVTPALRSRRGSRRGA